MLTAESGRDIVLELAQLKISGYIIKPFQQEMFDQKVGKVLGPPEPAVDDTPVDQSAVLVVDDSERVLAAARTALEASMKVLTASSGKEAVERYREARPGVVVVDLVMPEMDGFETLAQLRKLGRSTYIALAVRGDSALPDKARQAGYHGVLNKPFQGQDLVNCVANAASTVASPEEAFSSLLGEEQGCAILNLPDPQSKVFAKIAPALGKALHALAEDGNDRLIVDMAQVAEVRMEVVNLLAHLVTEAGRVGIRTAICSSNPKLIESLRSFEETSDLPYAASRDAARLSLG
jgi:CheY-like chemotaxis protein